MTLEELESALQGSRQQNRWSQKRLYQQFHGYVMSIAKRYAATHEDAQDICQDSFIKAFQNIQTCQGPASFQAWLKRIAVNTAIDHFRKKRGEPFVDSLDIAIETPIPGSSSGLEAISVEEKLALVRQLPTACRIAFNLYVVEGYSTTEIADQLQISEGTVRANLAKARIRLQKMILDAEKIHLNTL